MHTRDGWVIPDDKLDDVVHATADVLRRSGLSLSDNALYRLNDVLAEFLQNDPDVTIAHTMSAAPANILDPNTRFPIYGAVWQATTLEYLIADDNCIARVEESGSEGFYVEVAQQQDDGSWRRLAFYKSFELNEALLLADKINENSRHCRLIHKLQDAPRPQSQPDESHEAASAPSP